MEDNDSLPSDEEDKSEEEQEVKEVKVFPKKDKKKKSPKPEAEPVEEEEEAKEEKGRCACPVFFYRKRNPNTECLEICLKNEILGLCSSVHRYCWCRTNLQDVLC